MRLSVSEEAAPLAAVATLDLAMVAAATIPLVMPLAADTEAIVVATAVAATEGAAVGILLLQARAMHPVQTTAAETLVPTPPDPTTVLRRPIPTPAVLPLLLHPTETEAADMREEAEAATAVIALEATVVTEEDMETEVATAIGQGKVVMDRREEEEVTAAMEDIEATEVMILAGVVMVVTLTAAAAAEVAVATTVLLHQEIVTGLLLRETPVATPLPVVAAATAATRSDLLAVCVS